MTRQPVTQFAVTLPDWLCRMLADESIDRHSLTDRALFAIDLSQQNVNFGTGGPFGAAVFDNRTGVLVSAGVNLVLSTGLSLAHAEIVALSLAQRSFGTFDLSEHDLQLVTSAEPCWMCLGAIHWSGVRSVVCSARDADVREIGFDEGHKPQDWSAELVARGIQVTCDVERAAAVRALQSYQQHGGEIYNAGAGGNS
jgi:tRNA(Arg) A34 adenosine deaminase TadA